MFMEEKGTQKSGSTGSDIRRARRTNEMSELNKEPDPAYLPLHLGSMRDLGLGEIKEEAEGSAFAKSAFAVKKSSKVIATNRGGMSASDVLSSLQNAFPAPQRAYNCFRSDLMSLDALSAVAQKAAVSAGDGTAISSIHPTIPRKH